MARGGASGEGSGAASSILASWLSTAIARSRRSASMLRPRRVAQLGGRRAAPLHRSTLRGRRRCRHRGRYCQSRVGVVDAPLLHAGLKPVARIEVVAAEADPRRRVPSALLVVSLHQQCRKCGPAQPDPAKGEPVFQLVAQSHRPRRQARPCRHSVGDRPLCRLAARILAIPNAVRASLVTQPQWLQINL